MQVTQAEFARMKRVSRKTVTAWKSEGRIVLSGSFVDVEASEARLAKCSRSRSKGFIAGRSSTVPALPSGEMEGVSGGQGNSQGADDSAADEDLTPEEEAHSAGFHAGIRSVAPDLVAGLPAIATEAALQAGVSEDSAQAFRAVFHDQLLGHLAQILAKWELPHAEMLVERVRCEAR